MATGCQTIRFDTAASLARISVQLRPEVTVLKKSDLVATLSEETGISKRLAKEAVDLFFEMMAKALERGERIEIRGFGSFRVHNYNGYRGRNPRTGHSVEVLPKRLPLFRQSRLVDIDEDSEKSLGDDSLSEERDSLINPFTGE